LKLNNYIMSKGKDPVAPRAGAWIETQPSEWCSHPEFVAPRAGAWIETGNNPRLQDQAKVAPRAGAWIETKNIKLTS